MNDINWDDINWEPLKDEFFRQLEEKKPLYAGPKGIKSPAMELADRECARLLVNMMYEPPITEEDIGRYAKRYGISRAKAQDELRKLRGGSDD